MKTLSLVVALWLIMQPVVGAQENSVSQRTESTPNQLTEEEKSDGYKLLFDGNSFAGWKGNKEVFRIADGTIIAGSLEKPVKQNEFLRTEKKYENFELRLQFKLLGEGSNAGIQFRTAEIPDHHEVSGYQADMGNGWWGCLYDESRRNKILTGPAEDERDKLVKQNQWNDYRIRCEGEHIQLWINGKQTVDYREADAEIAKSGIIAVQIHGGPPAEAHYRSIRLKVIE